MDKHQQLPAGVKVNCKQEDKWILPHKMNLQVDSVTEIEQICLTHIILSNTFVNTSENEKQVHLERLKNTLELRTKFYNK